MEGTVFDETLLAILKECHTLPNFLDIIFGFLKRRTDFYCIATDPKSAIGLPKGWAEYFVKEAFVKWKSKDAQQELEQHNPAVTSKTPACNSNQSEQTFSPSDSYNGAVHENYTWSQTVNEVNIIVRLPEMSTAKDIEVLIQSQKIRVKHKKSDSILLAGELCEKVKHNDAIWSLDKRKLDIHLDKSSEMWWNCLTKTEPKLDISKFDCSRPFDELSEENQAQIEELTWNQERKLHGLPTSEDIKMRNKLAKAFAVEGSPFKGVDPSTVLIESDGSFGATDF
ncbi:hypothetical protein PPYR_13356 [Photinus pyralis]|uniref:Nuclear migration protein nudC n=2 Tax=Photinus pyralis TaxID=7054 RepID=A0A5N4A8S7_PHOPY|nr:hypothetical protein PPYR_13356 [Photinus pyralis]